MQWLLESPTYFVFAFATTAGFAFLAWSIRGVTVNGAFAGLALSMALFVGTGPAGFATLVWLFVLTWVATRLGYARKQQRGTAERKTGRTASQVFANLGVAAACGVLSVWHPDFRLACVAALTEAAADTVSSEFGQAHSEHARLITTWQLVPAGTDGGVTSAGTIAGLVAAITICNVSVWVGLIPWDQPWIALLAGLMGMLLDSYLGAWFERKSVVSNNTVNFASTASAAAVALLVSLIT